MDLKDGMQTLQTLEVCLDSFQCLADLVLGHVAGHVNDEGCIPEHGGQDSSFHASPRRKGQRQPASSAATESQIMDMIGILYI